MATAVPARTIETAALLEALRKHEEYWVHRMECSAEAGNGGSYAHHSASALAVRCIIRDIESGRLFA